MERQRTVQKGNSLLQKQEEQLQELINSVAEELGENVSRLGLRLPSSVSQMRCLWTFRILAPSTFCFALFVCVQQLDKEATIR